MFIRSVVLLETIPDFKLIMVKIYTRFQPKRLKKPYPFGVAHTYIADV